MRERLRKLYEDKVWEDATRTVTTSVEQGYMDVAKRLAVGAINNWKQAGKPEMIVRFNEWLVGKGINLDEGQSQ